jgi:23S rRNA (adenine2503-C2)-methyltransferase
MKDTMEKPLPLIYDLDLADLQNQFTAWGEPAYRAKQVWQGLYQQLWAAPEEFTSLPSSLREKLAAGFRFQGLTPAGILQSKDHETTKTLFQLDDKFAIEAVLMLYEERRTLCISSQAGCAMGCVFCATGQMGFKRNLTSGEIVEQVLYYARQLKQKDERVTNVVVMGMGEPFHNYKNTMAAIDRLNDGEGFKLGERRFTISTVGLIPLIRQFADEKRQINLAISLHGANDIDRSALLPVNRKYPIDELMMACREYIEKTGRRLTFEWALIQDVNDSPETARELGHLIKGMLCHVNVIPLNPTRKYSGHATTHLRAEAFKAELDKIGIPCTIRVRRGIDIQAGCGQLATEVQAANR